jgi:REP element-mobilizing transposase RayT
VCSGKPAERATHERSRKSNQREPGNVRIWYEIPPFGTLGAMSDTYTYLLTHFIFSTKGRNPWIPDDMRPRLHAYIGGVLREHECALHAVGGIEDHMHILVRRHPTRAEAEVMRLVKSNTSKWIHETFAANASFEWQRGYAAFSVSKSGEPEVIDYIAKQREHHGRTNFLEELRMFLDRYGLEYDPQYLE